MSVDRLTTSNNGINTNVRLIKGGDISWFMDNSSNNTIWNGWTRCGILAKHDGN
jgi:hypothetical protein